MGSRDRETRERPTRERPVDDDPKYQDDYKRGQKLAKEQWDMGKPLSHVTDKSEIEKPFYKGIYDMNKSLEGQKVQTKKKGGTVKAKCMARGGECEVRGKTKGRMV